MIVLDASTLVGAALKSESTPARVLVHASTEDMIALSDPVEAEIVDVLSRPKFARLISAERRAAVMALLYRRSRVFAPLEQVADCRDPRDNIYLELALAAEASVIISSDNDLLVLSPWRGVRILKPADYLNQTPR